MKLPLSWIESYFEQQPDWNMVWSKLTMAGIEVESVCPVAPQFSGIVVAQVVECVRHPDADKLSLCKVNAGVSNQLLQIVCGAPNVQVGVKVPCAKVGAVLPDGLHISERKMRGIISYGMLCSGSEIACPDGVDGLLILPDDAPVGVDIRDYLGLNEQVIEFKITPNRGDCLSVAGVLREIGAITGYKSKSIPGIDISLSAGDASCDTKAVDRVQVTVNAPEHCPNYSGLIIRGVDNTIKLPEYIQKRLIHCGIKNISAVVDIANYVMLELGQPMHAFDVAVTGEHLQVRMAKSNETLKLLDGSMVDLQDNTLIICDSQNKPCAIAGVMGGFDSGINLQTRDLILESAYFNPVIIAGKAKQYALTSDAAHRYERGVDPQLQHIAILYAADLIAQYCGGKVGVVTQVDNLAVSAKHLPITIKYSEIDQLIGVPLAPVQVNTILQNLGFSVSSHIEGVSINVLSPSYRFDITIKQDIIEEVARSYGYDNIQPIMPCVEADLTRLENIQEQFIDLKQQLVRMGYTEIISYSFVEDKYEKLLGCPSVHPVEILNPIAGFNVMRTSLFAGLVKALINNINRGHKNIKLFELARVFYGENYFVDKCNEQPLKLAGLLYGNSSVPKWYGHGVEADFFDLKHVVEELLLGYEQVLFSSYSDYPVFHPGRCAKILVGDKLIGIIGQIHPKIGQQLGLDKLPYMFELDLSFIELRHSLDSGASVAKIRPVSKFQKVERDLAFIVARAVASGEVIAEIWQAKISNLIDINVFDVYQGDNLTGAGFDAGMVKSVAVNFVFQADKTLNDEEISAAMAKIIDIVTTKFEAQLRQ